MKKKINYIVGDATEPTGKGNKVIVHCCNNIGAWGSGFVRAVSNKWVQPEYEYRNWSKEKEILPLGEVQFVKVEKGIVVANMIGQVMGFGPNGEPPVRYEAIRKGLQLIFDWCFINHASVHCPRFGAALAGGSWEVIEQIIQEELCDKGIEVTVYDFVDTTSPFYIPSNK